MKIFVEKLGCSKNNIDAELMESVLMRARHIIVSEPEDADIIVINTCGFIESAKKEAIEYIFRYADMKDINPELRIIVTGCLSQRYAEDLKREIPEIDAFSGVYSYGNILKIVQRMERGEKDIIEIDPEPGIKYDSNIPRMRYERSWAELKIADGCNNFCSYCVIPYIRGEYRSKRLEKCVEEAEQLVQSGVRELILVAQETTRYGVDLYSKYRLCELLEKLSEISGLKWIRLMYCNLWDINDELLDLMKKGKVLPYIDVPIQNVNERILRLMNRRGSYNEIIRKISYIREKVPEITFRSTLITGFPGETEEEFEENVRFLKEARLDRVGVFTYSPEEGTKAFELEDNISEDEKQRRFDILMTVQQQISLEKNREYLGRELDIQIEGYDNDVYFGRSYRDAPGIDGIVLVESDRSLNSGDFVKITVTHASEYDLEGERI